VDAPCGADLDGDVDMERDSDDEEVADKEEEDGEKKDEEEEDDNEEEDEDEDDGKEPRTIGQGEMVNSSADNADTMVDDQPMVLPEQGQEIREHTPRPQPPAPSPWPQTPETRPQPQPPKTHPLSRLECLGLVTPQKPHPVVPTLREAEAAGNASDVNVDQQLRSSSAGGDSLPNGCLPNVPLPGAHPDGSVGEK